MSTANPIRPRVETLIPRRLLDVSEAGRYLGMGHKVIRQLVQTGELPYVQRIAGRSPYLFDISDLDRWIEIHKIRAGAL
jgi:excisionase family DNA binding protein